MTTQDLLVHQTHLAFDRDPEMSLKTSLQGASVEMAEWKPDGLGSSIAEIVWHVAWCKLWYCQEAFGLQADLAEPSGYTAKLRRLDEAQAALVECLDNCTEEALARPVATQFHNESGAHLLTILAIHDVSHGASIRVRKRLFSTMA